MKRLTLIILALAAICSFTGTDAAAQAKFTTRKEKLSDLMYKTTKVVLTGNELLDESFKEEVIRRWRITPYEFCTFDEFIWCEVLSSRQDNFSSFLLHYSPPLRSTSNSSSLNNCS